LLPKYYLYIIYKMDTLLENIRILEALLETNISAKDDLEIRAEIKILENEYNKLQKQNT